MASTQAELRRCQQLRSDEDLQRVRSFQPVIARRASWYARLRKWVRRNPALAAAVLFCSLSFIGMVEYTLWRSLVEDQRIEETLSDADKAFSEGRHREALDAYRLYIALGGTEDRAARRVDELAERTGR